ncbi:MAG: M15 family metallopeptidase [Demequina sp.]|uniref:M15 family metallopeptidase n=1 Tax=Demequina sp. TaxID=2050685 RepID=UPI003A876316
MADVLDLDAADFADADSARDATAALERATADLEAATASVDDESQRLADAAESALLAAATSDYDSLVDAATADLDATADVIEAVTGMVEDESTLSAIASARANLRASAAVELQVDDSATAQARVASLAEVRTALLDAVVAAQESHTQWLTAENERRDAENAETLAAYEEEIDEAEAAFAEANEAAVAARQEGWEGQPTGVSGSNGNVSSDSLCEVDFAAGHSLQCDAAAALEAADADYYAETGDHLTLTDSYRSYASQVRTRAIKGSLAATPGTSNHGWGMAVDLDYASATWLTENGARYGWVHPTWARSGGSKPEWWHLEYVATEVGTFEAPEAPDFLEPAEDVLADIVDTLNGDSEATNADAAE